MDVPDDGSSTVPTTTTQAGQSDFRLVVEHWAGRQRGNGENKVGADTSDAAFSILAPVGCPKVDVWAAGEWVEENTILGRSLTGALSFDGYRLKRAFGVEGDRVRLRIRENEQEVTTLDRLRLIAVDHSPGLRAYAVGDRVVVGSRVVPFRVVTTSGLDVTGQLDGLGSGFRGGPGDTLLVELWPPNTPGALSQKSANPCEECEVIIEDGGGKGGGVVWRAPEVMSASQVDAEVLRTTGLRFEARDATGQWIEVARHYPREYPDEAAIEGVGAPSSLRVVFIGEHELRFIGRLGSVGASFTAQKLPLWTAVHSRLGDVAAALDSVGSLTTELAPDDTLDLEFGWLAVPEGQTRELLLLSKGVYTANLPARQEAIELPKTFALAQNQPNPFAGKTTIRFQVPHESLIRIEIFDLQGRRVCVLADRVFGAGSYAVDWDQQSSRGTKVRTGVYLCRMDASGFRDHKKLVVTQ